MAIYIGGKKVQETGGKYQSKGIPESSSNRPHHTKRERVGSRETGFTFRDVPIKGGKPAHTPAEQFENLRLRKNELQHIPYSGDDSGRNMYQMGIQNLLGRGDKHKQAYLKKYPIGGRINLGVPAAFNALGSNIIPGLSTISRMFGNTLSGAKKGLQSMFAGPMKDLGFEKNKFMQNLRQAGNPFWNQLQSKLGINQNQNLPEIKSTATQEDIVSPMALSRTDQVPSDTIKDQYNIGDYFPMSRDNAPQFTTADLPPSERFPDWLSDLEVGQNLDDVGYWDRYDQWKDRGHLIGGMAHGGDIQSDAYARLKAINDSMHEM